MARKPQVAKTFMVSYCWRWFKIMIYSSHRYAAYPLVLHTHTSGGIFIPLYTDYIISDARHAQLAIRCETHDHHPLNFSDHLPLSLTLSLTPTANAAPSTTRSQPRLNWRAASEEGSVEAYGTRVDEIVRPHLGKTYNSISSLYEEVRHVSASIVHAASSIIPTRKPKKGKKRFSTDPELRDLSTRCKSAWKKWKKGVQEPCSQ